MHKGYRTFLPLNALICHPVYILEIAPSMKHLLPRMLGFKKVHVIGRLLGPYEACNAYLTEYV
ncbi:unnamed protein product [Lupinus luteus]|uniref:Uncharacterized protein n=1 Tax=Lupinus luteus TaxID=3873 RepID=A0AAV1WNI8_LUPLU